MKIVENVICTMCSILCDDLIIETEDNKILNIKNACPLGASKFKSFNEKRIKAPRIKNKIVSLDEAIEKAAEILVNSRYPLFYGWSNTTNEAIRIGTFLAEALGGLFDSTSSVCHGPTVIGMQDKGLPTATLGQIKNRADLVIFWGSNPLQSHPRHVTRHSVFTKGRFVNGRKQRKIVVIDVRKTATAKIADTFLKIEPNMDFEVLATLRMLVQGKEPQVKKAIGGIKIQALRDLAEEMKNTKFGVLFFGLGLTMSRGKSRNIEIAISLVHDLNIHTKFVMIPMRGHYNVTGSDNVACWLFGYPFAIDFSRGYPFYNPGDTTAVDALRRNFIDSALIVASDPISHMPLLAARNLAHVPIITLSPHETLTTKVSTVVIPTAIAGIESEGTAYRMDGVPMKLKKVVDPPENILSDFEVLDQIYKKIQELQ